ncbi:rna polymerase-associated protein rtf1 homolog [Stylonychia lemnae]|uniref:Rna polymerase-associated protein rtf1 homolog n=1 Tax=Stylonychia lemnae TaxID=5949 RepID=A0A078A3D7_STYLE|nr:rna polymerase-associated protein rtf1 homolog [Stylonychia lemnae]|eukprot:CDW76793.1 rna polymerase-associated protein rtf1 homolog [Stylonychia lemnae]
MSDQNQIQGVAQTLSQRKAQQKKVQSLPPQRVGTNINNQEQSYYTEADIPQLIKNRLGYNQMRLFVDSDEENTLRSTMKNFEVETLQSDRYQKEDDNFEKSDKDSNFSSQDDDSQEDEFEVQDQGQTRGGQRQSKRQKDKDQQNSSDSQFEVEIKHQKGQDNKAKGRQRVEKDANKQNQNQSAQQEVLSVDQMKRIIIKRARIEQWIESPYFKDLIKGTYVRVSHNNTYRLGEVVDAQDKNTEYELGQVKTNIQISIKIGQSERWQKCALISNQDATEGEFQLLMAARRECKNKPVTLESVKLKVQQIKELEKLIANPEEVEKMVNDKMRKKFQDGNLKGLNLSSVRIELENKIGIFQQKLKEEDIQKDARQYQDILTIIKGFQKDLEKVDEAIKLEELSRGNYMRTVEAGQAKYENIEYLEKLREAEEWTKYQDYMKKNPNAKKQPFFMKILRQDSSQMTEAEKQRLEMQKEIELIRLRSQLSFEENKKESYYQQMERKKKQYIQFHQSLSFSFDQEIQIQESDGKFQANVPFDIKTFNEDYKPAQINQEWMKAFDQACEKDRDYTSQKAKIVNFDEYFRQ